MKLKSNVFSLKERGRERWNYAHPFALRKARIKGILKRQSVAEIFDARLCVSAFSISEIYGFTLRGIYAESRYSEIFRQTCKMGEVL